MKNYKRLFKFLKGKMQWFYISLMMIIIIQGLAFISPLLVKTVLDDYLLTNNETIVTIKVPRSKQWGGWVRFSSATVLVPADAWSINDARRSRLGFPDFLPSSEYAQLYADAIRRIREGRETMSEAGFLIRSLGADQLDTKYKNECERRLATEGNIPASVFFSIVLRTA